MTSSTQAAALARLARKYAAAGAPDTQAADQFADCDAQALKAQIGTMNILAISGGRVTIRATGITLPVAAGYSVTIDLAAGDTYTVRRIFKRGAKTWVKGELTAVDAGQVGEIAYRASCFHNGAFGTGPVTA